MTRGAELLAEGRALAPPVGRGAFRPRGRGITWHAHLGLSDWAATAAALEEIVTGLAADGQTLHRYGLCLSRSMGVPEAERASAPKETGPRLAAGDWARVAGTGVEPHLGDFMIGTPAGVENTCRALAAGVTAIGNLGQFLAFDPPGHRDDDALTAETVRALGVMAARRADGALVHSYLDDGPAMQLAHLGSYVGWAALELHAVEGLAGARLAHCHGGLVPESLDRAVVALALDDLRGGDSRGTMTYGNTVSYDGSRAHDLDVLADAVRADVATQLHRPTGHAINPVPLSEAERIPSAAEVLEVHRLARELEREVRAGAPVFDWPAVEALTALVVAHARAFRDAALAWFAADGADVTDVHALLLALRTVDPAELEARLDLDAPADVRARTTWKQGAVRAVADRLRDSCPRLDGVRIVLATLEVHDVVRDALARVLPERGADVVVLPSATTPAELAHAAADEDAAALVVGTYNGEALGLGRTLTRELERLDHHPTVVFGGVLNEDDGGALPVDARPGLQALGIRCVDEIEALGPALTAGARG